MDVRTAAARIYQFTSLLNTNGTKGFTLRTAYDEYEWAGGGYEDINHAYRETAAMMEFLNEALANVEPMSAFQIEWHRDNSVFSIMSGVEEDSIMAYSFNEWVILRRWFKYCVEFMYGGRLNWEEVIPVEAIPTMRDFIKDARLTAY